MSESTAPEANAPEAPKPTPPPEQPAAKEPDAADTRLPDDHPLVTALATLKAENKTLKAAADSGKSEAEKVADRLSEVERQYAEAEAKAARRDVALEHRLSKEDAALLDAITDEKAMRALAERLAGESDRKQNHVPREGSNPKPGDDKMRDFVRDVFGRDD